MIHSITNESRGLDPWGNGAFGASRGRKKHKGRDYCFEPGEAVKAPMDGLVTRVGHPYNSPWLHYKLIELLTNDHSILWRFFYVDPVVVPVISVSAGETIGYAQDITLKYDQRMKNHVHVECIMDPDRFFKGGT